jgi:hypothetical protein
MGLKTRHYRPPAGFLPRRTSGGIDESVWARVAPLFSQVLILKNLVFLQVFCFQHLGCVDILGTGLASRDRRAEAYGVF